MSEVIRSIHARVEVDSNKQTYVFDLDADSITELEQALTEWFDDIRDDGAGPLFDIRQTITTHPDSDSGWLT